MALLEAVAAVSVYLAFSTSCLLSTGSSWAVWPRYAPPPPTTPTLPLDTAASTVTLTFAGARGAVRTVTASHLIVSP